AHCRRAKYEKDCHVVYRQSLIFLHLSHFSQKNKAYLALEIDFVSDLTRGIANCNSACLG
ncbi:MAG: hypothetical protein IKK01_06135, partial [Clostridia bacterium]|nr:hypothetical protein [Clostridia bacterium]